MKTKQTPIFLHIPKNAGTYVMHAFQRYLVRTNAKAGLGLRRVNVKLNDVYVTVIVKFLTEYWKQDPAMESTGCPSLPKEFIDKNGNPTVDPRWSRSTIDTLNGYIKNNLVEILAIIIEPQEVNDYRNCLFNCFDMVRSTGKEPKPFMVVREPYKRMVSMYNYITSGSSLHEPTHRAVTHETFEDYAMSSFCEDSWLIRAVTGAPLTCELSEHWYNSAVQFISEHGIHAADMNDVDKYLEHLLFVTYKQPIIDYDKENLFRNQNKHNDFVSFDSLKNETQQKINKRIKWDVKLYDHLTKK